MSNTNDFVIANDSGQQVRLDIEDAFQQLATNNAGSNKPTTPYNHQWYANETTGKLTFKDATTGNNDANYFNLANLTGGLFVDQASTINGTMTFNDDVIFQGTNGTTNITFDASIVNGSGGLKFKDFASIRLGTDDDFVISHFHNVNSFVALTDFPTVMQVRTAGGSGDCFTLQTIGSSGTDTAYRAQLDAGQIFNFNGAKKLETTANGITVQGAVTTQDINMSNLSSLPNEVDNTQGSWSIQEGVDDLFLINRINGKKYKFNLTEVT